ncbi:unnamed protein product [Linum trigynum]|uniref:Uncharacterized protein n=1 Tax=Linum trigynum TaxID=586398 RepID=A0AAV2E4J3_9ROSI
MVIGPILSPTNGLKNTDCEGMVGLDDGFMVAGLNLDDNFQYLLLLGELIAVGLDVAGTGGSGGVGGGIEAGAGDGMGQESESESGGGGGECFYGGRIPRRQWRLGQVGYGGL